MNILDVQLDSIAPGLASRGSLDLKSQAAAARNLFRTLGLGGVRTRVYYRVVGAGVEIRLPEGSTEAALTHMHQILDIAFAGAIPRTSLLTGRALLWFVELHKNDRRVVPALAGTP